MVFDDLTDNQRQLVTTLVEELASGNYSPEFIAYGAGKGWRILLEGVGETQNIELGNLKRTDLLLLADTGYITLHQQTKDSYRGQLGQKAHHQHKVWRFTLPEQSPNEG